EIIKSPVGMPGRAIWNNFIQRMKDGNAHPKSCVCHCIKTCDSQKSPYCIIMALYNAFKGNLDKGYAFAGSNAFRAKSIESVKDIFNSLKTEYENYQKKKQQ
ncbi:MAG TPA: nitronate monooxygenase, partial [Paludibacteraceae bacterium]|nr:nitronate monooxygenase [Paludibacteraceae bacterium]